MRIAGDDLDRVRNRDLGNEEQITATTTSSELPAADQSPILFYSVLYIRVQHRGEHFELGLEAIRRGFSPLLHIASLNRRPAAFRRIRELPGADSIDTGVGKDIIVRFPLRELNQIQMVRDEMQRFIV